MSSVRTREFAAKGVAFVAERRGEDEGAVSAADLRIADHLVLLQQLPVTPAKKSGVPAAMDVLRRLELAYPEWFAEANHLDLDTCARDDLERLMSIAPDPFLAGFALGKLTMRLQIESITGRA